MTQPLYMKIKEMIKQMAVAGTGGERLPTVAELSSRLTVNPRLVERAFRELREEGYLKTSEDGTIYPKEGRSVEDGTLYPADKRMAADTREKELLQQFDQVVRQLYVLSVQPEELEERVNVLTKRRQEF